MRHFRLVEKGIYYLKVCYTFLSDKIKLRIEFYNAYAPRELILALNFSHETSKGLSVEYILYKESNNFILKERVTENNNNWESEQPLPENLKSYKDVVNYIIDSEIN